MNRSLYCLYCIVVLIGCFFNAPAQVISTIAGNGTAGYSGDGGNATNASFEIITTLALDGANNVYICDQLNHCVRKVTPAGIITTVAGTGVLGSGGDGGPATNARLFGAWGVAADNAGNIYITDQWNYTVRKVNTSGIITTIAGTTGVDGYSGDGGAATNARFRKPLGIAVDNSGNVYVSDVDNRRIRKIDIFGTITNYGGNGTPGFSGDGGPATNAQLGYVWCMATDEAGNLYMCDSNRIRRISTSGIISTIAGNGTMGFSGDGGPATNAVFNMPIGIHVTSAGSIIISDSKNYRVRKITSDGIINTIAGTGVAGYNGDNIPATAAQLNEPVSVVADENDHVFVSDMNNVRVRKVSNILYFIKGDTANIAVCQNSSAISVDALLTVRDIYPGFTDTWSLFAAPFHGTAVVSYSAPSGGGIVTPTGLTYTPTPGFSGLDSFKVKVSNPLTSDIITIYVTVDPLLTPGPITGSDMVCFGDTIMLYNAVAGGTWSVANGKVSISYSGATCVVKGETVGVDTVTYYLTNACGTASVSKAVTVNPLPDPGTISGPGVFCKGSVVNFSATIPGGTWSTSNLNTSVNALGQVKGEDGGVSTVIYTVSNAWCQAVAISNVIVEVFPTAGGLSGRTEVCVGSSIEVIDSVDGGAWSSVYGNATVDNNGIVTGVSEGSDFIYYSVSNTCGTDVSTRPITVFPVPVTPEIKVVLGVLYATKGHLSYQWRLNGLDIPGATSDTLYALETGIYDVVVSNSLGCKSSSAPLNYTGCSADDMEITPNPSTGEYNIIWCKKVTAVLYTIDGRLVGSADETRRVSLKNLPPGMYMLSVFDNNKIRVKSVKIVKL